MLQPKGRAVIKVLLMNRTLITVAVFLLPICFNFIIITDSYAMTGYCANCHTMHNSQNNLPMRYDSASTPLPTLLRGTCYGCHARGGIQNLWTPSPGADQVPQVYHTGADLAGGNFAYINLIAPGGDSKGHNISDLTGVDNDLYAPPGGIRQSNHFNGQNVNTNVLRCDGTNGCHGNRGYTDIDPSYEGLNQGAHHDNLGPTVNTVDTDMMPGHGYRFLLGVDGLEDTDWQATKGPGDHNEYLGRATPTQLGCTVPDQCHGDGGIRPPNRTISEFCATCHGDFHTLSVVAASIGIGATPTSPFLRHPSDLELPGTAEFASYRSYKVNTPVARQTLPGSPSTDVSNTPGEDSVMCLSCHLAHGSAYSDILRWDYSAMNVGAGGTEGCFACHSNKN